MPIPEDIHIAYESYYTSDTPPPPTPLRSLYRRVRIGYLAGRFGYSCTPVYWWERVLSRIAGVVPRLRVRPDFSSMWLPANPGRKLLDVECGRDDALKNLAEPASRLFGTLSGRLARTCRSGVGGITAWEHFRQDCAWPDS